MLKQTLLFCGLLACIAIHASAQLIYPMGLEVVNGAYYISDRAQPAVLRFSNNELRQIYTSSDNNIMDMPISLLSDGQGSLMIDDPGVCAISKLNLKSYTLTPFSPASSNRPKFSNNLLLNYVLMQSTQANWCPHFTSWLKGASDSSAGFVFTHVDMPRLVKVDLSGKQSELSQKMLHGPYGITSYQQDKKPFLAVADMDQQALYTIGAGGGTARRVCGVSIPFDVVQHDNKIYFDDLSTHGVYEFDPSTGNCRLIVSSGLKYPMGLAFSGDLLGIVDAGDRSLKQYDFTTKQLKTLYRDTSTPKLPKQPWGMYVGTQDVYLGDFQAGALVALNKQSKAVSNISSATKGTGGPILTGEAVARDGSNLYLSDATRDVFYKIDPTSGNRQVLDLQPKTITVGEATDMVAQNHQLYVADWAGNGIFKIDLTANHISEVLKLNSTTSPFALSLINKGMMFISEPKAKLIEEFNVMTGKAVKSYSFNCSPKFFPAGISWDGGDTLYLADASTNQIDSVSISAAKPTCTPLAHVTTNGQVWRLRKFDDSHLIFDMFGASSIYLLDLKTHQLSEIVK